MNGYDAIASLYDAVNADVDYDGYAARIAGYLSSHGIAPGALVAELGCGTGRITRALSALGYDMIGIDNSEGMLDAATAQGTDGGRILYLLQDMCEFELYGTVAAVVCTLDGVNHLTEDGDLEQCFSLVHNYLDPDGLFVFDLNTPLKFETEYASRDYIIDGDDSVILWRNSYDVETSLCDFDITVMTREEDDRYSRDDAWWCERAYDRETVTALLARCGFDDIVFAGEDFVSAPEKTAHRWYVSARAVK